MKKPLPRKLLIAAACLLAVYLLLPGPLVVSDRRSECSQGTCKVSFQVRNIAPYRACRRITAASYRRRARGKGAHVMEITGSTSLEIELDSGQRQPVQMTWKSGAGRIVTTTMNWCS